MVKKKFSISMDEELLKKTDDLAKSFHMNRSQFIGFIMEQGLRLGANMLGILQILELDLEPPSDPTELEAWKKRQLEKII